MARQRKPNRKEKIDKHEQRVKRGTEQLAVERKRKEFDNDWNLDWFFPAGQQQFVVDSFNEHTFTIVDAPSGCGKTSIALWLALNYLKDGLCNKLVFVKSPTEVGDDAIGFLSGDESDKLKAHMETTKYIFHDFMSKSKFEADSNAGRIRLTIPNFVLGTTWDYSVVLIDEAQLMSPDTTKLLLERCGVDSKYIIMGDSRQRYAVKRRADGLKDFIEKVTYIQNDQRFSKYDQVGYVRMTTDENRRSEGSKFITKLYEGDI